MARAIRPASNCRTQADFRGSDPCRPRRCCLPMSQNRDLSHPHVVDRPAFVKIWATRRRSPSPLENARLQGKVQRGPEPRLAPSLLSPAITTRLAPAFFRNTLDAGRIGAAHVFRYRKLHLPAFSCGGRHRQKAPAANAAKNRRVILIWPVNSLSAAGQRTILGFVMDKGSPFT